MADANTIMWIIVAYVSKLSNQLKKTENMRLKWSFKMKSVMLIGDKIDIRWKLYQKLQLETATEN